VTTEELQIQRRDGVVEVVFNRPERRNAFTADMYAGMRELCDELREDRASAGSWSRCSSCPR
jgi:enoyl-CoA hydratase/carnithine racemase